MGWHQTEFNLLLSTRVDFSFKIDYLPPDVTKCYLLWTSDSPGLFCQISRTLKQNFNCDWKQQTSKGEGCKIKRKLKWSKGSRMKYILCTRQSTRDLDDSYRASNKYTRICVIISMRRPNPKQGQVRHRLESTWKSAIRPTDGYTKWTKVTAQLQSTPFVSRSSGR